MNRRAGLPTFAECALEQKNPASFAGLSISKLRLAEPYSMLQVKTKFVSAERVT
jgi:hypothetical protein